MTDISIELNVDLLVGILQFCDITDIGRFAQTCKLYSHIVADSSIYCEYMGQYACKYSLYEICGSGHLSVAKWIYKRDPSIDFGLSFYYACFKGHLRVAQWIEGLNKCTHNLFTEYTRHETAFILTCQFNHFEMVQWLYGFGINKKAIKIATEGTKCTEIID